MHYLDNALLGVHGIDKVWLGGVWLVYSACNIKGPLGAMLNIYICIRAKKKKKKKIYIYIYIYI